MINKRVIPLAILIIALSIGYYFVIFLPQKFNETQREDEAITKNTSYLLDKCLAAAKSENGRLNEETLKFAREENKDGKYDLSGAFDSIERMYAQDREDCFKKYPQ